MDITMKDITIPHGTWPEENLKEVGLFTKAAFENYMEGELCRWYRSQLMWIVESDREMQQVVCFTCVTR